MTTIDANNKPSAAVDTSNVIPFPDRCAAHKHPEITESQTFSWPLRQAVHKAIRGGTQSNGLRPVAAPQMHDQSAVE